MSEVIDAHNLGIAGGYIIEAAMQRDIDKLKAENAKLLELVADMREAFIHGNCYRWCEFKEPCDGKCQYIDRMRELGVIE